MFEPFRDRNEDCPITSAPRDPKRSSPFNLVNVRVETVSQLFLVSPSHLNESDEWKMEPLAGIWCGKPENGMTLKYELADGRHYIDAFGLNDAPPDEDLTCMVVFNQHC